ncbi:MAG: histone [Candidatus Norongarragalinales archaeon]
MAKAFALFEMDFLLRSVGAQRVDENASRKLAEILEDDGKAILHKARILARHAGRKNITKKDVALAAKCIEEES